MLTEGGDFASHVGTVVQRDFSVASTLPITRAENDDLTRFDGPLNNSVRLNDNLTIRDDRPIDMSIDVCIFMGEYLPNDPQSLEGSGCRRV